MKELFEAYAELFTSLRSDYAYQQSDGRYSRTGKPLTQTVIKRHLYGKETVGGYLIDEQGQCKFSCFDADSENGLQTLELVQAKLAEQGISAYLETSRRGGHLWVFLTQPLRASQLRAWLLPFCPTGIEFYPKQAEGRGYGSLIRLPLGVHRKSGQRYPFVHRTGLGMMPVASSLLGTLEWLQTVERVQPPVVITPIEHQQPVSALPLAPQKNESVADHSYHTIRDWCANQDPFSLIGRYIQLTHGLGCCPFGEHHSDGKDLNPSFCVYQPRQPGDWCWFCYTWDKGGNQFDFLRMYYGLSGQEVWRRIREGGTF